MLYNALESGVKCDVDESTFMPQEAPQPLLLPLPLRPWVGAGRIGKGDVGGAGRIGKGTLAQSN